MIQSAIAVIVVLGILIAFHEFGHFLLARLQGIGVKTFSLGFGPKIWSIRRGQTEYQLSLVPLGGYVQLVGETPDAELPEGFAPQQSFSLRPPWQRILVVLAGPVFNFLLAWVIYWGIFWAQGQTELLPHIGRLLDDSPAAEAGLTPGDLVTSIDGTSISTWQDLAGTIQANQGSEMVFVVENDGEVRTVVLRPRIQERTTLFGETVKVPMVGITASGETRTTPLGPLDSASAGLRQTWVLIELTVEGLVKMVERIIPVDTIGGPIMIAQMVGEQAQKGIIDLLALTALISINLGLLNLLPIPVLDGGHILFFTIETIIGRPLDPDLQQTVTKFGMAFLLGLMGLAIYNDIARIVQ
ncbi:MAG TPA: RIP metalloprotease RseP [Desulfomicrobiaceae bacterium]|nr:RIP metalloprotease RseP [Desulfomicrobiaceae bacterium]